MIYRTSCKAALLCLLLPSISAISMTKIASYADGLIKKSTVPGQQIRMCSCAEQSKCIDEMEQQVQQCADQCVNIFSAVTTNPQMLVPCYKGLLPQFNSFADCLQTNLQSCSATPTNQVVPYTSITTLLALLESEAEQKKQEILQQQLVAKIRPVAEAAFSFAGCVKQCFVKTNAGGYCFDRVQCQPSLTVNNLATSLKRCSKGFNWKKEAGSLCSCAQNAGIMSLNQVCPLLNAMG